MLLKNMSTFIYYPNTYYPNICYPNTCYPDTYYPDTCYPASLTIPNTCYQASLAIPLHLLFPIHAIMLHLLSPTLTVYKICYLASQMISFLCSLYKNIPIPSILSDSKIILLEPYLESIVFISEHRLIEYIFTVNHQNMEFLLYLIKSKQ